MTTLLIILVLSLIAVAAIIIATTEKRTTFADATHTTAIFAADSGGEAAIHFLRLSDSPPRIVDFANLTVRSQGNTTLYVNQAYDFQCTFDGMSPRRDGWGVNFVDYNYAIASRGRAAANSRSDVDLLASRLFREGY